MKRITTKTSVRSENGRSIVEVLIAMTIGMVILIALSSLFYTNKKSFRANDDKSRLDDEGRLALNLMAFHVRMAGYGTLLSSNEKADDQTNPTVAVLPAVYTSFADKQGQSVNAIRGCVGGFTDSSVALASISCTGTATQPDSFLVRYVVDASTTNVTSGGIPTDCLGAAITPVAIPSDFAKKTAGAPSEYIVENRFYIQTNNGVPELYCRGNGGVAPNAALNAGQPIAENVENLKITYGVSRNNTQTIDRYLNASQLSGTDWQRVVSVRICMVVRSANDNLTTAPQSYIDCDGTTVRTPTDRRLRSVFSTVVAIRSRAAGAT